MQGRIHKRVQQSILVSMLCCMFLGGCASGTTEKDVNAANTEEAEVQTGETGDANTETEEQIGEINDSNTEEMSFVSGEEQQEENHFSVSYFDEDTDGLLQYAEGYLYGYLGGRIFRMDEETGEISVLFETKGSRSMHFCMDKGYLYFLTIPEISFPDGAKANLYRMNRDGSGLLLLAESVPVGEPDFYYGDAAKVHMSVYEDVLYIMPGQEACCFRLLEDGSVKEADTEDTLYGLLPEGYSVRDSQKLQYGSMMPSIPYSAAHYGSFIVENEQGWMRRFDAESGRSESIPRQNHGKVFVTYEGIYVADPEKEEWIRYDIGDVTKSSRWRECDHDEFYNGGIINWDEDGVFLYQRGYNGGSNGDIQILYADWEGNETPLVSFEKEIPYTSPYGMEDFYLRNGWLYYTDNWEDDYWLMRISLAGGEPEKLCCYATRAGYGYGITEEETVEKNAKNTGEIRISTSITKLWLKEDEHGAPEINAALKKIYEAAEAEMEEFNRETLDYYYYDSAEDELNEEERDEWLAYTEEEYRAYIKYADEDFLCVGMYGYDFVKGLAHGYYWYDYYVFDRNTGQRLSMEDFVNDGEEEIKELVKDYLVVFVPNTEGEKSEDALEPDRFFLTAEGFGIHYDVYEVGIYAEGPHDIIIPFEGFDVKEGMRPGE